MNTIFSNDTKNVIFKCIFREKVIFAFLKNGNIIFVEKRNTIFTEYTENVIFSLSFFFIIFFFEKDDLSFSV